MINYDKSEIKELIQTENIFDLLLEWGGDPEYTSFGIISSTICHNHPGEGSRKLYFYSNSGLFQCYTGCSGFFDVFELTQKIAKIQWNEDFDLNAAVRWVARRFGISGRVVDDDKSLQLEDWKVFSRHNKIKEIEYTSQKALTFKEYDSSVLNNLNYSVKISPWLNEGISQDSLKLAHIGFYPVADQITIPHYDENGLFIGLRGRSLVKEDAEKYGKYRPMKICGQLYSHPLGMNLYGLNWNKKNIKQLGKAIVFESEKSVLMYGSYFGWDNNISVACCGSNISSHQIQLLIDAGAKEIIIAFDRQFKSIGDEEFKHLTKTLKQLNQKYKNFILISFIFDKNMITKYKASPIDEGSEKFIKLFKERVILNE